MGTQSTLDSLRSADSILATIMAADDLTVAASRDGGTRAVRLLAEAAVDPADQVTAIAAVHALAQVFDETADEVLVSLLGHEQLFLREHAAWAFGARLPRFDAVAPLLGMVIDGGFAGMIAQRTLEQWSAAVAAPVALAVEGALLGVTEPGARARLVETIGQISGRIPERMLFRVAVDPAEATEVRAAAIAAIGDRGLADAGPGSLSGAGAGIGTGIGTGIGSNDTGLRIVTGLAAGSGVLAEVARLAVIDLTVPRYPRAPWSSGTTVAQLFLHADIDGALTRVGSGDNGGIATLLVRLGDALVSGQSGSGAGTGAGDVGRVLTLSRGGFASALDCLPEVASTLSGHAFATVPFLGEPVASADAWSRRIATQRGIRRVLRAAGPVDAIHLRMADVGTLAASTVARELDIPVVFTVAPDPHSLIRSLESAGALTRATFGTADAADHFWFRVRLVQRLAADAAHTVLFPRPDLERDLHELVGIDVTQHPERHSIVAEGIDIGVIEASLVDAGASEGTPVAEVVAAAYAEPDLAAPPSSVVPAQMSVEGALALGQLDELLATLPLERRALPLAITVGRLHRVKGMATLVETWAADPALQSACNLLIVGGDLTDPTPDEAGQLDRIHAVVPRGDAASAGLLLAGHRSNDTVARWLAATRLGRTGLAAANGVYVCASMKEEFGIALLEAMAAGLTVVAPNGGGPATYVEQGVTGFLVDTGNPAGLATGVREALDLAAGPFGPEFAERAMAMVSGSFTIQAMAATLSGVYRDVAEAHERLRADAGNGYGRGLASNWTLSAS
ncbi:MULTISPECIES: glycosyltransferase [unclassified Cryobacterium]|uniref:glycosyltransferase n=1 Tax=unclassified Cryobacterium TaxID=2649013 RepID=UPI001068D330|nr:MULTISPECIES: glycosyltransferase [unclassified Cryobacterium]TFB95245.1 glycosyltransferase [Cryobacterium sp. MDB2-A-1]TFC11280.1 glycosyltransferase [Cryobacterium sp. MDB2-A-2]TFC11577.1 glycosyltransferase [Cryobacterium sp. MDB2-33-2]TFC17476.1 glycosyltransferase [Cryobacterium sp. MDB2-10]